MGDKFWSLENSRLIHLVLRLLIAYDPFHWVSCSRLRIPLHFSHPSIKKRSTNGDIRIQNVNICILQMSGAAVSTRGRYMSPEERKTSGKKSIDRPLYLHIQAVNQQDVKGRIMKCFFR